MKKTALHDIHEELNAKMIDFAGYMMPVQYEGVNIEHITVKKNVGVFDVSHMGEFEISCKNSDRFIQFICSNDIMKLKPGKAQYNCLVNDNGGIIDDLIVYKIDEEKYLLVVNASNIEKEQSTSTERKGLVQTEEIDNLSSQPKNLPCGHKVCSNCM